MPEKKRPLATKARNTETRMTKPQASKNSKHPEQAIKNPASSSAVSGAAKQLAAFEGAMKFFHMRRLKEAKELFEQAGAGPERDVAQRARLHIAVCERRMGTPAVELGSAEEHYNYG